MSIDLTYVLAAARGTPAALLETADETLLGLGFRRDHELLASHRLDGTDDTETTLEVPDLKDARGELLAWGSLLATFVAPGLTLDVQFDRLSPERPPSEGLSAAEAGLDGSPKAVEDSTIYLFIGMQKAYELYARGGSIQLHEAIGALATETGSLGGYAGFEVEADELPARRAVERLLDTPGRREYWGDVHIVPLASLAASGVESAWERDFVRDDVRGHAFFVERRFLERCREFGSSVG